jgi:exosortase A-associated hydrolase 2
LTTATAGVQAFFFAADPGTRFALFHPAQGGVERGAILYVHPFAEEMNKSRRMAALQARAFARVGFSVLQFDLYGCGDSSGDFVDARWDIWKRDVAMATRWLADHSRAPLHLGGLRLGATLALECWSAAPDRFESALVWQPVLQGESFMTQFLRLALAGDVVRESGGAASGTDRVRKQLDDGEAAEVAGYALASALVRDIEQRRLADWSLPGASVHWLDVRRSGSDTPASVRRTLDAWRAIGVSVTYDAVAGDAFWSSYDIIEVPDLIAATLARYARESK